MAAKTHYETLGVAKDATGQEIKKTYQKLAKKWHPDVNKSAGAEAKFKEIAAAYEILGNEERRKAYDEELRYGGARRGGFGAGAGGTNPFGAEGAGFGGAGFEGFGGFGSGTEGRSGGFGWSSSDAGTAGMSQEELLNMFFGGAGGGGAARGFDFFGGSAGGTGRGGHPFSAQAELEVTLEQAYKGEQLLVGLDGDSVKLTIPAKSAPGDVVRVPGGGTGGGELYVSLRIAPHAVYEIDGDGNLLGKLQIAPWHAALGGKAQANLPDGAGVSLKIPAGMQSGRKLRLSGKGLKRTDGSLGDVLFEIEIVLPPAVSQEERALYRKLSELNGYRAEPKKRAGSGTTA